MKLRLIAVLIVVMLFLGVSTVSAVDPAQTITLQINQPTAMINDRPVKIDVPPQIIDDRTMVPVRFVGEPFGAEFTWDGQTQKVTVQRADQTITLKIGSPLAQVNDRQMQLDVPPRIVGDRTLVPIRFIAEALGMDVDWEPADQRVVITQPGDLPYVMAFYFGGSYTEFKAQADHLNQVSFRWFDTNEKGEINAQYPDSYELALDLARDKNITISASIFSSDSEQLHVLLSSKANRQRLIDNAMKIVEKDGFQGINLDLEMVRTEDREGLNQLVKEMRARTKPRNIELSLALPPKDSETDWFPAYDYEVLGELADRVVIMAHDLHYKGGQAGAIAPLPWVEGVLKYAKSQMPAEKILLALGVYGYDWPATGAAQSYTPAQLEAIREKYQAAAQWDQAMQSPFFKYRDEKKVDHTVWFEDDRSLRQKMNLPEQVGIAGISIWKLGNGFPEMWQAIEKRIK